MSNKEKKKRGYSNLQLAIASLGFGSVCVFWSIYNSFIPLILDAKLHNLGSLMLSATTISTLTGFIMTIDNFFGLIFQPVFGRRSDHMRSRFGKRMPYLLAGIPSCALLFILMPLAAKIQGIAGILCLMVVVITFNFIMSTWRAPCVAIMPDLVPPEYQSDGNAVVNMVAAVATIMGTLSATLMGLLGFKEAIASGDYISVFVFGALLTVLFLLIILFAVKWPDNRKDAVEKVDEKQTGKESLRNLNLPADVKMSMFFMMFALLCISGSSDGFGTYFTLYAVKLLQMNAAKATLVKTAGTLGAILLALPAGILGRKLGRKRTITAGLSIVITCHVLMFMLPYVGGASVGTLLTVLYFIYAGAFILININTLPIMLAIGGKSRFGAFTGYYYTATFTAAVICPTVIGFLIGITGTYNTLQVFCMLASILAVICIRRVKHGENMSAEEEEALSEAVKAVED